MKILDSNVYSGLFFLTFFFYFIFILFFFFNYRGNLEKVNLDLKQIKQNQSVWLIKKNKITKVSLTICLISLKLNFCTKNESNNSREPQQTKKERKRINKSKFQIYKKLENKNQIMCSKLSWFFIFNNGWKWNWNVFRFFISVLFVFFFSFLYFKRDKYYLQKYYIS